MKRNMKMKNILLAAALVLSLGCTYSNGIRTEAASQRITTRGFVKQERSNWSWLASAINSVKGSGKVVNISQGSLYKLTTGEKVPANQAKSINYTCHAAEIVSNDTLDYVYSNSAKSFNFLKQQIDKGYCPILVLGKYSGGRRVGEQVFTMYSYSAEKSKGYVYLYNSATGKGQKVLYENLVSKKQSCKYDRTAWVAGVKDTRYGIN